MADDEGSSSKLSQHLSSSLSTYQIYGEIMQTSGKNFFDKAPSLYAAT
jgi:hypothetical protein